MYTVLLRELDYAEDFDIAELEIELEAEGRLDQFIHWPAKKLHHLEWADGPQGGARTLPRQCGPCHDLDPDDVPRCGFVGTLAAEPGTPPSPSARSSNGRSSFGAAAQGEGPRLHQSTKWVGQQRRDAAGDTI